MKYDMGVIGLGVMGQNLALNIASRGYSVAGFDLDATKQQASRDKWAGKQMQVFGSLKELVDALSTPRKILVMVPAGKPVDAVLNDLKPVLEKGDILIDGGNSFFQDTIRRGKDLEEHGINFIGSGVSGGEEGALHGPALMPGGPEAAYRLVEPVFNAIAAKVDGEPCCAYIGEGGAGHYVKMVHNGIEYGIMQLICEAYDILKNAAELSAPEMSKVFTAWNEGELNSYLIEITAAVLAHADPVTGQPLVDVILDTAGQKGTGKWTSQNAMDLGVAVPTINAALEGRILSAMKEERVAASKILHGPGRKFQGDPEALIDSLRKALRLAVITCYAQGFALMREASKEYKFNLNLPEIAKTWKGGCIIRSKVLDSIRAALAADPKLANLLLAPEFAQITDELTGCLRAVVATATELGIACLAMYASLGYIDSYRAARLPANLLQGQRDFFGAHRYERLDRPRGETFHTEWAE